MTIKSILLSLTSILVILVVFLAGQKFWVSYQQYDNATFAEETSLIIDELLTAAGNWAVERGATNSALAFPKKVPDNMKAIISARREKADVAYNKAVSMLESVEFEGKARLMKAVQNDYNDIVEIRQKVDKSLNKSKIARSGKLMKGWVPAMSKLVLSSQELRFSVGQEFSSRDPQ